jgi:hypothetical protein
MGKTAVKAAPEVVLSGDAGDVKPNGKTKTEFAKRNPVRGAGGGGLCGEGPGWCRVSAQRRERGDAGGRAAGGGGGPAGGRQQQHRRPTRQRGRAGATRAAP